MKIAGIVAEYNPFHNGHRYHIEQTRAKEGGNATHIVAVMSGSFMQRGEPSLLPKTDRVRMALDGGVDLVLELPLPWAMASAETFAVGAIAILDALRCVDTLSFGCEAESLDTLEKAVSLMNGSRFSTLLRYRMEGGRSYAEARQQALEEVGGSKIAAVLSYPNNTLAIEYLQSLKHSRSNIQPFAVTRRGAEHDAMRPLGDIASASYIRTLIREERLRNALPFLPITSGETLAAAEETGRAPADEMRIERAILSRLRAMTVEEFAALPAVSEGIENRLYAAVQEAGSLDELWTRLKTKRYPMTRLRRLVYSAFLGVCADDTVLPPPYVRPLGANERGMEILHAAKEAGCALPIVSRPSRTELLDAHGKRIWALECAATDQYALCLPRPFACRSDLTDGWQKE